jgi:predicted transcriptional regulator
MSKKYIQQRDKLIPDAEKIADMELEKALKDMRDVGQTEYKKNPALWRTATWNKAFHQTMNRMAHEKGLMVL